MRLLFAIASCQAWEDNGCNQAIRDTWLKDVPGCSADGYSERIIDYRFFRGKGPSIINVQDDTIILAAPDDYNNIIRKTQEIHAWAYEGDYDFVFQCWSDTYVNVPALLASGFEKYDYFGHVHSWPWTGAPYGFLGGGEGWWTSRRACKTIMEAKASSDPLFDNGAADDLWVGLVMGEARCYMVNHPGYGTNITKHGSVHTGGKGQYNKEWMFQTYNDHHR